MNHIFKVDMSLCFSNAIYEDKSIQIKIIKIININE